MKTLAAVLLTAAAISGCSHLPDAVPLEGPPDQLEALIGEWGGSYAFEQGDFRTGSISFVLRAAGDTARGDVLMMVPADPIPSASEGSVQWVPAQAAVQEGHVLSITFVRAAPGAVLGELDPYMDPGCRCLLVTRFQGRLEGETIAGSFTSHRPDTGEARTGRWTVSRRHP